MKSELEKSEVAYPVYRTDNYQSFTFIKGNRVVSDSHVRELTQQISDGYSLPPIIVNENGGIIDGQHRYCALMELEKPIEFIIRQDDKANTLQRSNTLVSKWKISDHINYHCENGNENYISLKKFVKYSKLDVISASKILGRIDYSKLKNGKSHIKGIREGHFYVTSESDAYQFVDEITNEIRAENKNSKFINSLRSLYNLGVDNRLLVNVANSLEEEIPLLSKESKIVDRLVKKYNQHCPKNEKIKIEYDKRGYPSLSI